MRIGRIVGAILSALACIATILGFVLTLQDRRETPPTGEETLTSTPAPGDKTEPTSDDGTPEVDTRDPTPEPPAPPPRKETPPPSPRPRASEFPLEVTLRDGEQTVFLSGRASAGIQFNRIGDEQLLTLRLNAGTSSRAEAVLGGGARFPLQAGKTECVVSVLGIDFSEKTARVRVDCPDTD